MPNSIKCCTLLISSDGLLPKPAYILCVIDQSWFLHWHFSFSDWHFSSQFCFEGLFYPFLVGSYVFEKMCMRARQRISYSKVRCFNSKLRPQLIYWLLKYSYSSGKSGNLIIGLTLICSMLKYWTKNNI